MALAHRLFVGLISLIIIRALADYNKLTSSLAITHSSLSNGRHADCDG